VRSKSGYLSKTCKEKSTVTNQSHSCDIIKYHIYTVLVNGQINPITNLLTTKFTYSTVNQLSSYMPSSGYITRYIHSMLRIHTKQMRICHRKTSNI